VNRLPQVLAGVIVAGVIVGVLACQRVPDAPPALPPAPCPGPGPCPVVPDPTPCPDRPKPKPKPGPWGPREADGRSAGDGAGWRLSGPLIDAEKVKGLLDGFADRLSERLAGIYFVGLRDGAVGAAVAILLAFALIGRRS
jgi:hypothetical protein